MEIELENKLIKLTNVFYLGIIVSMFILFVPANDDFPTYSLQQGKIFTKNIGDEQFPTHGNYNYLTNHINIDITSPLIEVEEIFYHEYAHWLWYKKLSSIERNYWYKNICNEDLELPGYTKEETCKEWFAIIFAGYLMEEGYRYDMPREFEGLDAEFVFIGKVYHDYIMAP